VDEIIDPDRSVRRVTANLVEQTLDGKTFGHWVTNLTLFTTQILRTTKSQLTNTVLDSKIITDAYGVLSQHVKLTGKRSVGLKGVAGVLESTMDTILIATPVADLEDCLEEFYWARFLVSIRSVFADPGYSVFDAAKIRQGVVTTCTLWVLAKLIVAMLRPAKRSDLVSRRNADKKAAAIKALQKNV
jgi:hypothetical protein